MSPNTIGAVDHSAIHIAYSSLIWQCIKTLYTVPCLRLKIAPIRINRFFTKIHIASYFIKKVILAICCKCFTIGHIAIIIIHCAPINFLKAVCIILCCFVNVVPAVLRIVSFSCNDGTCYWIKTVLTSPNTISAVDHSAIHIAHFSLIWQCIKTFHTAPCLRLKIAPLLIDIFFTGSLISGHFIEVVIISVRRKCFTVRHIAIIIIYCPPIQIEPAFYHQATICWIKISPSFSVDILFPGKIGSIWINIHRSIFSLY